MIHFHSNYQLYNVQSSLVSSAENQGLKFYIDREFYLPSEL